MEKPVVRYDEMDSNRTTARILDKMTNPELIAKRKIEKEEKEMNEIQAQRIGL